jgi:hypothetical protein
MIKLKPEVKETWFALMDELADRQTTGALVEEVKGNKCYCVLGVLGLACQKVFGQGEFTTSGGNFGLISEGGAWDGTILSPGVINLISQHETDEDEAFEFCSNAYRLNDSLDLTFAQIKEKLKDKV